jgi:vancomycin permeability regulator SanA
MRRLALDGGVPEAALVLDPAGVNSYATLANLKDRNVLAVSHYYHLARIKLTARRMGIACATAPCPMSRRLAREPYFVARECAAFVSYYLFRA